MRAAPRLSQRLSQRRHSLAGDERSAVSSRAEGIETAGQLQLLRRMGCRFGQGYFFSRPTPAVQPTLMRRG
jgi:predicted signal transduction protein with EAL and GGDEF domain